MEINAGRFNFQIKREGVWFRLFGYGLVARLWPRENRRVYLFRPTVRGVRRYHLVHNAPGEEF